MSSVHGGLIRRMVLATCVLLLFVGGAFSTVLISISEDRETTRLSRRSQELFVAADAVHRHTMDLESAQRAYALSGDGIFLQRWQAAHTDLLAANARLDGLATTETQQRQTRQITQTSTSYAEDYSQPAVRATQRGDPAPRSVPTLLEGDRRIAQLRVDLGALRVTERDVITARDAHTEAMARREMIAILAGLVGSALVIALVSGYQTRLLVQPIRRAATMADRLAGGDLSTRMPETGKAEIGHLERSFNIMGASLECSHRELGQLVETQTALRRVATLVARGGSPSEVLTAVVEELGRLIGASAARIVRFEADGTGTVLAAWGPPELELPVGTRVSLEGDNVTGLVQRTGKPELELPVGTRVSLEGDNVTGLVQRTGKSARMDTFDDASGPLAAQARARGRRAAVSAPINVDGRRWGAVTAATTHDQPMPPGAEARLAESTDLIGTAIANAQAHDDLIASRARVVLATDQTRRRIERNLHDGVQQRLLSLGLDVRRIQHGVPAERPQLRAELSEVVAGINGTVDDVREISRGVHPALLTEGGLRPAFKALARRSAVAVQVDVDLAARLPEPVEVAAYYAVAESLANAAKHAHASLIRVSAAVHEDHLDLTVRDDGSGGADPDLGSGLVGLTDRIEALGGTIRVDSPVGHGTCLQVQLPLAQI